MSMQNNEAVPCWVRSILCILAVLSVFALAIAEYNGAEISIGLSIMVGYVALQAFRNAFQVEGNARLISDIIISRFLHK